MTVLRFVFLILMHVGTLCECSHWCVHIYNGRCTCVCMFTLVSACVCMFTLIGASVGACVCAHVYTGGCICVCACSHWWVHYACRCTWMPAADAGKFLLSCSTFLFLKKILSRISRAFCLPRLEVQASLHTWTIFHVGFRYPNASSLPAGQELQLLRHLSISSVPFQNPLQILYITMSV